MLAVQTSEYQRACKMPVDFTSYLLSASPPATKLDLLSYAFSQEASRNWQQQQQQQQQQVDKAENEKNDSSVEKIDNELSKLNLTNEHVRNGFKNLKPIIIRKDDLDSDGEWSDTSSGPNSGPNSGRVTPTSPCSPKSNKKVSFADHRGYALATVRIMTEPSDHPPKLAEDVFKTITNGAVAAVSGLPPFKLNFTQPASDYMAFRDKVGKSFVSLENVILRDYNVLGTIKVKNICFDKRVFFHMTKDNWKSSQDLEAKYVQPFGGNLVHNLDTFSFEFDIDPQTDGHRTIEFAVCFETPGQQYWDSNGGANYGIVPTDFNAVSSPDPLPTSTQPSLARRDSWTDYGCWHHVNTAAPYY
ncbi:protein phosphatase 1 regulatory subunit 3B-like [Mya arenaria]|nr:protein phosphatase 1 regulatory subunit 3B-like [Mya arenaria]